MSNPRRARSAAASVGRANALRHQQRHDRSPESTCLFLSEYPFVGGKSSLGRRESVAQLAGEKRRRCNGCGSSGDAVRRAPARGSTAHARSAAGAGEIAFGPEAARRGTVLEVAQHRQRQHWHAFNKWHNQHWSAQHVRH